MQLAIKQWSERDFNKWDKFVKNNNGDFLQSFGWGEFQKQVNLAVIRLVAQQGQQWQAVAQVVLKQLWPSLVYFYIARGPIYELGLNQNQKQLIGRAIIGWLKAHYPNSVLARLDPIDEVLLSGAKTIIKDTIQPQQTWLLDLSVSENNLLRQMKKHTRYNIKLAKRKGVKTVNFSYSQKGFAQALVSLADLIRATSQRAGFVPHHRNYYQIMAKVLGQRNMAEIFLAEFQGQCLAASLVVFWQGQAYFIHAGKSSQQRHLKPNELLQWAKIKRAKEQGCQKADFWGISEKKWPGLTAFKKGFGGYARSYPQGMDVVLRPWWYKLYKRYKLLTSVKCKTQSAKPQPKSHKLQ